MALYRLANFSRTNGKSSGQTTATLTDSNTSTLVEIDTNQTTNSTSTEIGSSTSTTTTTEDLVTGSFTISTTATSSSSGNSTGDDARGSFTESDSSTTSSTTTETGDMETGSDSLTVSTTASSSFSQSGGDGSTSYSQTDTDSQTSTTQTTDDLVTGNTTQDTTSTDSSTSVESGTDLATTTDYTQTVSNSSTATTTQVFDAFSSTYSTTTSTTDSSTTVESGTNADGSYSLTSSITSSEGDLITGDADTGSFSETDGLSSSTVTEESTNDGSGNSATYTETDTDQHSLTGTGDSETGDFNQTAIGTSSSTLTDSGTDSSGSFSVSEGSSDTYSWTKTGNTISGEATQSTNDTSSYSMVETSSNGSINFTLTENGVNSYSTTETSDTVTGAYSQTQSGTDTVTFVETGSNAGGNFTETVSGTQSYTMTETGNSDTGTFTRVESGSGSYNRDDAGSGATLSNGTVPISYSDSETGDTVAGSLNLTQTGTDPYGLLEGFNNVSNAVSGTPGNLDFSPFGKPFEDPESTGVQEIRPYLGNPANMRCAVCHGSPNSGLVNVAAFPQLLNQAPPAQMQALVDNAQRSAGANERLNSMALGGLQIVGGVAGAAGSALAILSGNPLGIAGLAASLDQVGSGVVAFGSRGTASRETLTYRTLVAAGISPDLARGYEQTVGIAGSMPGGGLNLPVGGNAGIPAPTNLGCFPANTSVTTQTGFKPIQSVQADDLVWGYDLVAREWQLRRVVQTYEHDYDGDLIAFTAAGEVIEATSNHPVWVVEGEVLDQRERPEHVPETPPGVETSGRWVDAGNLRVGDVLLLKPERRATVTQLSVRQVRQKVYNFQVEGLHTYAVGTGQVLVHNKPVPSEIPAGQGGIGVWGKVNVPQAYAAEGLTPQQIAGRLPVWAEGEAAHGALVVDGKAYLLKTNPTGRPGYTSGVVPNELVGEVGFTRQNANHIEAQSAAILRRLQAEGVDVSNAYVVVNRPFICQQIDPAGVAQGCNPNLNSMLPPGQSLTVYPTTAGSGTNVIAQPRVQTFTGK